MTGNVTDIVILGSGMAGGNAAKTLRSEGYDRRLVLIGDEPGVPFGRPPLSKTYMRGEEALDGWLVEPPDWYLKHDVEFLRTSASRIDASAHRIELSTGEVVDYSKLLIATGGRNRRLNIPGADLPGVYQLRTLAECDAIRQAAGVGRHAVIVGMGFIGSEVAASLRQLGVSITAVLPESAPLEYVLGPEMGEVMTGIHVDHGVELITHDEVQRFEGTDRVERAVTGGGRAIDCDFAIVAVGIQPNVEILAGTGVAVEHGVLVDATCRTNVPDIFAAGDIANHLHPLFGRIRVEHYNNAEKQGGAAARSMLGPPVDYTYVHSFWSDQYEHKLEYVGYVHRWDDFIIRGSLKDRKLVGFYLVDGALKAAVGFDRGGDPELDVEGEMAKAGRMIARGARPAPSALADEDQDLALL